MIRISRRSARMILLASSVTTLDATLVAPAGAQSATVGCYINFNTNMCDVQKIECTGSWSFDVTMYGRSIADLCSSYVALQRTSNQDISSCVAALADKTAHWSACRDTVEQERGVQEYWTAVADYYRSLAIYLRGKCGRSCRAVSIP